MATARSSGKWHRVIFIIFIGRVYSRMWKVIYSNTGDWRTSGAYGIELCSGCGGVIYSNGDWRTSGIYGVEVGGE
jgi:hypothetical protein